jgi:hypothetical protein
LFAAGEVRAAGWGGLAAVSRITGLARSTINRGKVDRDAAALPRGRVRRPVAGVARSPRTTLGSSRAPMADRARGAGRSYAAVDLGLEKHGEARRDPDRDGASDQRRYGAQGVGEARVLAPIQSHKAEEGAEHPDRDAQFEYINAKVVAAQAQQQPVIPRRHKKKELIGNFKNGGTDYRPKGKPRRVKVHDFEDKKLGKVVPIASTK